MHVVFANPYRDAFHAIHKHRRKEETMNLKENISAVTEQPVIVTGPPGGRMVRSGLAARILSFLVVAGPGLIVMVADNDAGAVSTYTQAGAQYGIHLLWLMVVLLPCTYFIQEMVVRLGVATGQGHAAMIYKRFGKWWGVFSLFDLQLVNFLTLVTEFAAISLAATHMGISPYLAVPVVAMLLIAMASTGSYLRWERMTVMLCALDLAWIFYAVKTGPSLGQVVSHSLIPQVPPGGINSSLIFLVIAIVGTTIAPWQLFFQQSCVADKRLRFADLKWEQLDTFIGAVIVIMIAGCMIITGDAARRSGLTYTDPAQMAAFLGRTYGPIFRNGLLLLMVNAAILGTTTISLASAWAYGEVKGWPHSLQLNIRKAPGFYAVYALCVLTAAGLVLIPRAPLQLIILSVQVLAGIMLPSAIIFLQLLLNDKELLGEYANKPWNNWVNWSIIILFFALSLILAAQVLLGMQS
jgi:Mn2+/Fe2+ NRAMP family transporter